MKKVLLSILVLLLSLPATAQLMTVFPNDSMVDNIDVTRTADQVIYFKNTTSQSITVGWIPTEQTIPSGWIVSLCDDHACHDLPHFGDSTLTMAPGDTNFLHLVALPQGFTGSMVVKVHISNNDNPQEANDLTFIVNAEVNAVGDPQLKDQITISPSPANDMLYLRARKGNLEKGTLALYDLQGKVLLSKTIATGQASAIDVHSLEQGIYIVRYVCKSGQFTEKVMVTH